MAPETVPVFVNGHPLHVPAGSTLAKIVTAADPDLGTALAAGDASATDARGLPVAANHVASAGAIFRVFRSARTHGEPDDA